MVLKIVIIVFLVCSGSFASMYREWEGQEYYDMNLLSVLDQLDGLVDNELPNCRGLGEYYALGDEILLVNTPSAYTYYLEKATAHTMRIRAENKFGGRSYIYDYEWNVVNYIIPSSVEMEKIGNSLIEWLTTDKYSDDGRECYWLLVALGYRSYYTDLWSLENAKYDVLGGFGGFLNCVDLRDRIWEIVLGGQVFANEEGREKCVRSILCQYDSYSAEIQKEVLEKVSKYLETADDVQNKYSKKIADFVLEKGGVVPVRTYWDYHTSVIPCAYRSDFPPIDNFKVAASLESTDSSTEIITGKLPAKRTGIESEVDKLLRQQEQLLKIRNKILKAGWYADKQDAVNDAATNPPPRGAEQRTGQANGSVP